MASRKSIWFHLGHALERARQGTPERRRIAGIEERRDEDEGRPRSQRRDHAPLPSADDLIAAGVTLVVDRALGSWGKRREPGFTRLIRAGVSGAAAALLVDLVRPLIRNDADLPTLDRDTADRLIAGVGQGLLYGAIVEPRVPGPALVKGALYGSVEYAVDPIGGLSGLLGSYTPQARLPVVGEVLEGLTPQERAYAEHLVFGIALAVIYESSPSSNGIRSEEE